MLHPVLRHWSEVSDWRRQILTPPRTQTQKSERAFVQFFFRQHNRQSERATLRGYGRLVVRVIRNSWSTIFMYNLLQISPPASQF